MATMALAGFLFLSMIHLFLPFVTCMSSGCVDGYCVMAGCPRRSGSSRSPFCWMSGNEEGYDRCGGAKECQDAVKAGGSCKAFSCVFFRAPSPFSDPTKTCRYKTAVMLRRLQNECSADGATFDSWARKYTSSGDLYRKFEPCTGHVIEEETKQVVKFCYCYNFCGAGQLLDGCEVQGLEGRLDQSANLFSSYKAICKIDCNPKDKLDRVSTLRNELGDGEVTKVVTITEGTTSSKTSGSGGSNSNTISASVGVTLKGIFSTELGYSSTTDFNWSHSSTTSFSRQESHQARIPVNPGDEVSVYQVVGICNNTRDGTVYTVNTKTLIVREKDGRSTEVVPE